MFQYRVQQGDTLYRIADYFDVSVAAILAANTGLYPNRIFPGQVILIPISGYLYQNYPWYYLLPYLFIQQPRRYWDDRRRWPRDWRDRDRRDRWDGRERRSGRDRRDGGRDRRGGRDGSRRYMGNWNDMLAVQADWEDDQWREMNDQNDNQRNDFDGVRGIQSGILPEQEITPGPMPEPGMFPWSL